MGFISTGHSYSQRGDIAMEGLDIQKVVDNIVFGEKNYQDLMRKQLEVLEDCNKYSPTVNAEKSMLSGAEEIKFGGYKISENCIKPIKKINTISD